jgi:TonB family protein
MASSTESYAASQEASTPIPGAPSQPQKVYFDDHNLTPPSLIEPQTPFVEPQKCSGDYRGNVQLSLIIDEQGRPRDVVVTDPIGNDFDIFAVKLVEADRFAPGSIHGQSVPVGRTIAVALRACIVKQKDSDGKKTQTLHLSKRPEQKLAYAVVPEKDVFLNSASPSRPLYNQADSLEKVGGAVSAPKAILQANASFSEYARKNKIQGTVVLTLIVDAHGLPQEVHVTRSLEPSLDQEAIAAVMRYRFHPAMKAGRPVSVQVSVEVRFKLY